MSTFGSQKGNTLVQVLITTGILGITALGFSTMMSSMYTAQGNALTRQNIGMIAMDIQASFGNEIACQRSLVAGTNFNLTHAETSYPSGGTMAAGLPFRFRLNNDIVQNGAIIEGYDLRVNRFELVNAIPSGTDLDGRSVYKINLIGQFSPSSSEKGGLRDFKTMNLAAGYVSVTGGTIANCSSTNLALYNEAKNNCETLGGTYDLQTKKCLLNPNLNNPEIASAFCSKLGGTFTNNKCSLGNAGGGGSNFRWWRAGIASNLFQAGISRCASTPSAGSPCSEEGKRCYASELNSGAFAAGASQVTQNAEWVCQ